MARSYNNTLRGVAGICPKSLSIGNCPKENSTLEFILKNKVICYALSSLIVELKPVYYLLT